VTLDPGPHATIESPGQQVRRELPWIVFAVVILSALTTQGVHAKEEQAMTLKLTSSAFEHEGGIPKLHTCQGKDVSPPLAWSGVPENAKSLVLIVDDPDAPDPAAPRMTWVHWVLYNIPPSATGLPQGVSPTELPAGTLEAMSDFQRTGYGGPCPPIGRHRYFHKLYALDTVLPNLKKPRKADVEKAMKGHVIEQAVLVGTYQKSQ
jgi:Raf kinase inhibitor-like YbhB/YbcL family protein